jgi:hypothetical protein
LEIGPAAGGADVLPAGSVQTQAVEIRNRGDAPARSVVVSVGADAKALQLPLSCGSTSGCTARDDGSVMLAEIPAGASVTLSQAQRIQPGYRGAVGNDWQAAGEAGVHATWRQALTAYATDVAVSVDPPEAVTVAGQAANRYVVTLSNAGPDDARDVVWDLAAAPDMVWLDARCTASGGAVCPATVTERISLALLPKSGSLKVELTLQPSAARFDFLSSMASAPGDTQPANNRAAQSSYGLGALFGPMPATDLLGRSYRLNVGWSDVQIAGDGWTRHFEMPVDVTGTIYLLPALGTPRPWEHGNLSGDGGLVVGSAELDGGRTPFVAVRDPVTALSELEGYSFNILGSRADASGKPLDAFVWSGRFNAGAFEICTSGEPLAFASCPAASLRRYEAALVGSEIELASTHYGVMRWRAARSPDGPVLVSSSRDPATGESRFMVGTPETSRYPFTPYTSSNSLNVELGDATFESASGVASPVLGSFDHAASGPDVILKSRGLPITLLLALNAGLDGPCELSATLTPTAQTGVFSGPLQAATWKDRACFAGPVLHVQTSQFVALLGSKDGPLMGRWLLQVKGS